MMLPQVRYSAYTLAVALCIGYFVQAEIADPGALKLLVFTDANDTLGTSEYSPVELIQPVLLLICASLFAWVARNFPSQRPIAFLFGGIAIAGAIRECDYFLDTLVADNFWQIPVGSHGCAAYCLHRQAPTSIRDRLAACLAKRRTRAVVCGRHHRIRIRPNDWS